MQSKTLLLLVLAAPLACQGGPPDASTSEVTIANDPESSSTGSSSTAVDASSTGDAPLTGSSSDESTTSEDSSSSTGPAPALCDGIDPGVLFSSTAHVGQPDDSYLVGLFSWWDPVTGDYDESADDFVVPEGSCWCITSVAVIGDYLPFSPMMDPEMVINFYDDDGELPNERWFSETTMPTTDEPLDAHRRRYDLDLVETAIAPPGRSWMSVLGIVQDGEHFSLQLSVEPSSSPTAAQLDLMDCPEFTHFEDCYPDPPTAGVQLAFEIMGAEVPCDL